MHTAIILQTLLDAKTKLNTLRQTMVLFMDLVGFKNVPKNTA